MGKVLDFWGARLGGLGVEGSRGGGGGVVWFILSCGATAGAGGVIIARVSKLVPEILHHHCMHPLVFRSLMRLLS